MSLLPLDPPLCGDPVGAALDQSFESPVRALVSRVAASSDAHDLDACYRAVSATLTARGLFLPSGALTATSLSGRLLRERERELGPATLAADALTCLVQLVHGAGAFIVHHAPSFSAASKQAALRTVCDAVALKTVTVRYGGDHHLVLCTGVGDFTVSRAALREIGRGLGLGRGDRRNASINPPDVIPEADFGLLRGMVSPFLRHPPPALLLEVCLLPPTLADADGEVAIPLSPCESLVVPTRTLAPMLSAHLAHRLPGVGFLHLSAGEPTAPFGYETS